ncbi:hypothetical protein DSL72_001067 [Monilinia vaccinii-corymbosi]|uniref:Uncharacterized protein n=1 Tax=Monilinia vaccinii-corymbosi TaxID=61207 RepID=A0A8A3P458_9HELO|nr:hypothetical protein DSL72_001067 [Monilinia vaccinii-corymbosi]
MGSPHAACVEEVDEETGKIIKSSRQSASVKASKDKAKERSKISTRDRPSSKASKTSSDSGYSTGAILTGSEISSPDATKDTEYTKESKKSRRPSMGQGRPSISLESRPPQTLKNKESREHRRSLSVNTDSKPEYYGVPSPISSRHPQTPIISHPPTPILPVRPRASTHAQTYSGTRPISYHAASASASSAYPPLSNSAYFQPSHQSTQFQVPPPSPAFNNYAVVHAQQATGYFQPQEPQPLSRSLSERFGPQREKVSAYGIREEQAQKPRTMTGGYEREYHYSDDEYDSYESSVEGPIGRTITRSIRVPSGVPSRTNSSAISESNFSKTDSTHSRESHYGEVKSGHGKSRSKSKARRDSQAMPPPSLPLTKPILRRTSVKMPVYDDDLSQNSVEEHQEKPPRPVSRLRRPSVHRNSVSYDVADLPREAERLRVESANSKSRRQQSYYEQSASSTRASTSGSSGYDAKATSGPTGYDAKLSAAATYLEEVSGPTIPLTAEALRKEQQRQARGSSRGTKSRGSRDLSDYDYRGTQATRTTRSGGGGGGDDDDVTIEVTGQAKVTVGRARIHWDDGGGKIRVHRTETIRDGSQGTSSDYECGYGPKLLDDRDRRSRRDLSDSQSTRSLMKSQHSYALVSPRPQERDRAPRERREDYEARAANW